MTWSAPAIRAAKTVVNSYRLWRNGQRPVWRGVYAGFADVPSAGPGHEGDWVRQLRAATEISVRALRANERPSVDGERALLPFLCAVCAADGHGVKVLDFGGGMGTSFVDVRLALARDIPLAYSIVEIDAVCQAARGLYNPADGVEFMTTVPDQLADLDVVHIRTALQYVDDYRGLLVQLLRLRPRYVLLAKLAAGEIPTFATAQLNLPGSVVPCWFHDVREIVAIAAAEGYSLRMRRPSNDVVRGLAVPSTHRIGRAMDLLFARHLGRPDRADAR